MTGSQKALKVISIIVIILSILTIAAGVLLLLPNIAYVNAGYPSMDGADQNQIAAGAAIVMALCGLLLKVTKWRWINDYALPFCIIVGMVSAVPITMLLG